MDGMDTGSGMDWDWRFVVQSLPFLAGGFATTLYICLLAIILMFPIALLAAAGRMSDRRPLRALAGFYVDFFRSTPFLVQLVWIFFALPMLLDISLTATQAAVIGLALYIGAYQAEVVRGGILSLEGGQRQAGLALGMTEFQLYRRIILPQALTRMIPPSMNVIVVLIKESAVISAVSVMDLMWRAEAVGSRSYRPLEPLTFAGFAYIVMILPLSLWARRLHQRQQYRSE
jgi:polar amino acid transport system permease protein